MKSRGVVEILDAGETGDGLHYLAMELLRGEDLAGLLRRRERLSLEEVLALVDALAEALDAAHAMGIVHRDVKPPNIFLARSGDGDTDTVTVKLLDFGVASLLEAKGEEKLTLTFVVVGTPGYLAPEQISASFGAIGAETDIFALGAVAYRALTGRPAFEATQLAEMLHAALNTQPLAPSAIVPELTADVDAVIALAIAKRPRHRYASARAFAADLRAAQEGRLGEEVRARAREFSAFSSESVSQTIRATVGVGTGEGTGEGTGSGSGSG
jgi:serine/threonine-protein kinase